jgi:putative solute:sodium symporter small subunit
MRPEKNREEFAMSDSPSTGDVQAVETGVKEVNFFKPGSPYAKDNMKLIATLVIIWAIAVFGFQFLIMAMQTPTPEPSHEMYTEVWPAMETGKATAEQQKSFAKATLFVLGKNLMVKPPHKETMKQALSATVMGLLPAGQQGEFLAKVAAEDKGGAVKMATAAIGLEDKGFDKIMISLLPTSLVAVPGPGLTPEIKKAVPPVMDLYLIHLRSALTDTTFMGFPFHYWFTAQFLLILFVLLCLVYAKLIDRVLIKHGRMKKEEL